MDNITILCVLGPSSPSLEIQEKKSWFTLLRRMKIQN